MKLRLLPVVSVCLVMIGPAGCGEDVERPSPERTVAAGGVVERVAAADPEEAVRPPNIILIVIDNLRADHVGAYGYPRPTTPNIDGLAEKGIVFRRAYAPSSWTKPSIGALFTSRHPSEHGAVSFGYPLDETLPTLAEGLRDVGYTGVGVTGNFIHIGPDTKMTRGFERWTSLVKELEEGERGEVLWNETTPIGRHVRLRAPYGREINREVRKLLREKISGPLFLYVHYMEPHASYDPPEPFRSRFIRDPAFVEHARFGMTEHLVELASGARPASEAELQRLIDLYDGEIATVDAWIGALLKGLEMKGLLQNAIVALVSDHGEAFGEHASWFHGVNLFGESLAVPFVLSDLRAPPTLPHATEDSRPVDLLDVPTTLLSLAGAPHGHGMHGRDLLSDAGRAARDLIGELHDDARFESHVQPRRQRLVITRWPDKLIIDRDGTLSRYDLDADGDELRALQDVGSDTLVAETRAIVEAFDRSLEARGAPEPLDPETEAGLRALGYVD
jgi:arylsulfatase A-like enzyme